MAVAGDTARASTLAVPVEGDPGLSTEPRNIAQQAAAWGERALEQCSDAAEKHWRLGLVPFAGAYAVGTVASSLRKPLWFDELFTFYISRLSSAHDRLVAAVYDGNPPLFYALTHASMRVFGESRLAERLPEMIGFGLLCLSLFFFVRRRCPSIYAFLAAALPLQTGAYYYAFEGRPYGIVLGMAGVSLLAWQSAGEGRHRLAWLALLAASIATGVSSHFYGVQIVVPLLVGEACRTLERRKVDWGVAGAMGLGLLPIPFLLPVARAIFAAQLMFTKMSAVFHAKPSLAMLPAFYKTLLGPLLEPFALAFVILALAALVWAERAGREEPAQRRMPRPELAAAVTYLFIPALMLIGTGLTSGKFEDRYAISAVLGVAVLFPYLLSTTCGRWALAPVACIAGVLLFWGAETQAPPRAMVARSHRFTPNSPLYPRNDDLPIAVASVGTFLVSAHDAPPQVASRLTYLADVPYVVRRRQFAGEVSLAGDRQLMPGQIVDYAPFVRTHSKFWVYVVSRPETEWLPSRLLAEGWKLECKRHTGIHYLFLATRE